jgi:LCP family protein required for cell wall assembly
MVHSLRKQPFSLSTDTNSTHHLCQEPNLFMSARCPKCQSSVLDTDRYCPSCGQPLSLSGIVGDEDDYLPLPGVEGKPDMRVRKRRRKSQRRWYRRPLFVTFLLLMCVLVAGGVAAAIYVQQQFSDINAISTPPPKVSGAVLDESGSGDIDTSPALRALEVAESGGAGSFEVEGPPAPATASANATAAASPVATSGPLPTGDGTGGLNFIDLTGTPRATPVPPTPSPTAEPEPTAQTMFEIEPVRETEDGSMTILLLGVDAPEGEPIDVGIRPDAMSVLHLDGETQSCRILSIPRETRAELPGYGLSRVNNALALGGVKYEVLVVEQTLGIQVDHYGLIDFGGIEGLVDAVGGVTVVNEEAFTSGEFTFAAGEIELDGAEAMAYSRYESEDEGDIGDRMQQVIKALISQSSGMDVARSAPKLLGSVEGHFKSDLPVLELLSVISDYRSGCSSEGMETASLEGETEMHHDPLLRRELEYVVVTPEELAARVDWLVGSEAPGAGTPVATP